jgi:alpha-glucoside transport system substrate-binding protein
MRRTGRITTEGTTMTRMRRWVALLAVGALLLAACGTDDTDTDTVGTAPDDTATVADGEGDLAGTQVSIFGAPTSVEADAMNSVIREYVNEPTGMNAVYEGSDSFEEQVKIRVEGGNPPDIALYPQPGAITEQAAAGRAVALEDLGFDIAELEERFGAYLMSLGEYEGKHYGIPTNVNFKSLVWYNKPVFEAEGYELPETYADMVALSEQMVADGFTPWCIGTGSDAATGWPATDWMEDILLRQAGPEVYDRWVTNDLPFDSDEVKAAAETFAEIAFAEGFVVGGTAAIPDIDFRDAPDPMVADPPGCLLHRQASFIANFFPEGTELGTDVDTFTFPEIDGTQGALIAGELGVVFADRPEVREFIRLYTDTEAQCAGGSFEGVSRISPNVNTTADCYADPLVAQMAGATIEALRAGTARFDASDLMPTAVGSGSFWTGMNEWMRGKALDQVLSDIQASWE